VTSRATFKPAGWSIWVSHPTNAGAKPFFSWTTLEIAIKSTGLVRVRFLHPTNAGAESFSPAGWAKPGPIILDPILQTRLAPDTHPKPNECRCEISHVGASAGAIFYLTLFHHGSGFWSTRPIAFPPHFEWVLMCQLLHNNHIWRGVACSMALGVCSSTYNQLNINFLRENSNFEPLP
jgi:hypothetical protein